MMSTKKLTKQSTQLPALNDDPYLKTASRVAVAASFLKFKQGCFYLGAEEDVVPSDTEVVPHMEETKIGWLKWQNGEVVEERMFAWATGHPYREDLGDLDRDLWEVDPDTGKAKDCWSETSTIPLKFPQTGQECTFTTASDGGRKAIAKLIYAWRYGVSQGKTGLPVVKLGEDSYQHKIKSRGRIYYPVFTIARWADEADLIAGETDPVDELDDEIPGF
jgi:hypothetical protein